MFQFRFTNFERELFFSGLNVTVDSRKFDILMANDFPTPRNIKT